MGSFVMCGIFGYVGIGFSVLCFVGVLCLLVYCGLFGEGIVVLLNGVIGMICLLMFGVVVVLLLLQEGQWWVVYNGEVYQVGCEIYGEICLLFDGLQCGVLLDGMYVFVSWDLQIW